MAKRGQQYIVPPPGLEDAVAARDLEKVRTILKGEWRGIRDRERDALKKGETPRVQFLSYVAQELGFERVQYRADKKGILASFRLHVDMDALADERIMTLFDDGA